jgi:hypothetical protein
MIYKFGLFELDLATVELRAAGRTVSLEPQVFALLALLVQNGERLVSKEEIVEKVWDGRVVSDAAVASRVKSARHAHDDGPAAPVHDPQASCRFVRHRAVAAASASRARHRDAARPHAGRRVMRPSSQCCRSFRRRQGCAGRAALPDELIATSRLHWLGHARGRRFV